MFQLQMDSKYNDTNIFANVTCATHESQSRFYENYLGRRKSFVHYLYGILKDKFSVEFEGISENDLYYYVNSVSNQPIRVEADELTYPIHILVRYKVEKALFSGELEVSNIQSYFNSLMKQYLDIDIESEDDGAFQDVHWSSDFGYFPTYALGSAMGAQIIEAMEKEINVDEELEKGDFSKINAWLKENIHQYSSTRKNIEIIKEVCHEEFDPHKYISYLKNKFDKIYK